MGAKKRRKVSESVTAGSEEKGWWPGIGQWQWTREKGTDLRYNLEVEPMGLAEELDARSDRKRGSMMPPGFGALVTEGGENTVGDSWIC